MPEEDNAHLSTYLSADQNYLICNGGYVASTLSGRLKKTEIGPKMH